MIYQTSIKMTVENGEGKTDYFFEAEELELTQDSKLQIRKEAGRESVFFETVKLLYGIDKDTDRRTLYHMETTTETPIDKDKTYYVSQLDEMNRMIKFKVLE
ncbi:glycosyltransferases [Bacillus sp. OxB-1]|uniref:hypothetical protein n=1 Tax=Bacillus sp. (strain OxB-1) TaxID=98228 RepID=UPI00058226D7|nr:hypothetical protein [Bacillus sp. OxB-1]BAQ10699.1 glycosyltransferases [Bacillus sp. OxB-1]